MSKLLDKISLLHHLPLKRAVNHSEQKKSSGEKAVLTEKRLVEAIEVVLKQLPP